MHGRGLRNRAFVLTLFPSLIQTVKFEHFSPSCFYFFLTVPG